VRHALEAAYVLHARPYRETSLLLEVLTAGLGRVGMVARGARRPRASVRGLLQPFQPLLLGWSGRGELRTLRAAEPAGPPWRLAGRALVGALHLNGLACTALAREDPHPEVFAAYDAALRGLARPGAEVDGVLRRFELALLGALGYGPVLTRDVHGAPVRADGVYGYDPEHGPVPASAAHGGLRLRGATLLALARGEALPEAARPEARALLRMLLARHFGARQRRVREVLETMARPLAGRTAETPHGTAT